MTTTDCRRLMTQVRQAAELLKHARDELYTREDTAEVAASLHDSLRDVNRAIVQLIDLRDGPAVVPQPE